MNRTRIIRALVWGCTVSIVTLLFFGFFLRFESFPGHEELREYLKKGLRAEHHLPNGFDEGDASIIYVLGGSEYNLRPRFETAYRIYEKGLVKRTLILAGLNITRYDETLGRNLNSTEWALFEMEALGFNKDDIEPTHIDPGFFGTLTEAGGIAALATRRGYRNIVLVSSPYHTKRVRLCFKTFLEGTGIEVYVYGSEEQPGLEVLLREYLKIIIYKNLLL